ncbi:hypothetical protein [Streptomyces sp.]|uniref:hypothetical protein n=1 Tax=Streptomyces sp. TaxID=1931 RepID=UPI002F92DF91
MFLIGLLLLAAVGAFAGLLIAENSSGGRDYTVTMFDNTVATVNTLGAFVAGVGMTLVVCLALALMVAGSARRRRRTALHRRVTRREVADEEPPPTDYPPGAWEQTPSQAPRRDQGP